MLCNPTFTRSINYPNNQKYAEYAWHLENKKIVKQEWLLCNPAFTRSINYPNNQEYAEYAWHLENKKTVKQE